MILSKVDDTINIVESYREFAASDVICLDFVSDFCELVAGFREKETGSGTGKCDEHLREKTLGGILNEEDP